MLFSILIFIAALIILLFSSRQFTRSAASIGARLKLNPFVIGIFIIGIGTSLPELISGIISVKTGHSGILSGNIIGANISNLLLVTGMAVALYRKPINLGSQYIYTDLHFLIGSFFLLFLVAFDGIIDWFESSFGFLVFLVYSFYLIKGEHPENTHKIQSTSAKFKPIEIIRIIGACTGIYFGAEYTISSLQEVATELGIAEGIISLTLLSLGTTLPELSVNFSAIKQGKPEMAVGNILGSCLFNTLTIPFIANFFGQIEVPSELLKFSLPVMLGAGLFFYLMTHDKKVSPWEGALFVLLYILILAKTIHPAL